MSASRKTLSSAAGAPVETSITSKTAGRHGPVLMEGFRLFEKVEPELAQSVQEVLKAA